MQENFREFLDRLRQSGELVDLHQPVDIRHIATLVDQADTALYFHNVIGYDMPVVSGIIRSQRARDDVAGLRRPIARSRTSSQRRIDQPIPPKHGQHLADARGDRWWATRSISTSCRSRCPRSTTAGR